MERIRRNVTLSPAPHTVRDAYLSHEDALSRCLAAARLALLGERWGYTFQIDCAADILSDVLAKSYRDGRRGTPRDVLAWIDFAETHPVTASRYSDAIPREDLRMSRLVGMANNWRRSYEAQRDRTLKHGAPVSFTEGSDGPLADRPVSNPREARQTAVDMLSELGLPRLGKLYPVAYAAAREAAGLTGDEIADELNMKRGTLVSQINRAPTRVPSTEKIGTDAEGKAIHRYSQKAHAEALRVDEYRPAGKRGDVKPMSGDDHNAWRDRQHAEHPVKVRREAPTRGAWNGRDCADWATDLRPATAARLAQAASMQRTRAEAASDLDRSMRREASGIPADS